MNDVANRVRLASRMAHIEPFEAMEIQTLARELEAKRVALVAGAQRGLAHG